jgi:glycosyltransferase involved in cell wall biosynthesis
MTLIRVSLVTLGDPNRVTGGYLYHRRMEEAAHAHDARLRFASFPDKFPLLSWPQGRAVLDEASGADVVVLDSIAASHAAPRLAVRRVGPPLVAMLHQPLGGIDHRGVRRLMRMGLDALAYARAVRFLVASESLARAARRRFPEADIVLVPPGKDVTEAPRGRAPDLRMGRRAAFLCVGNWVPRKGIAELLEAFALLPASAGTLHLVGEQPPGRYARSVRERSGRPDLADRVVSHGALPRALVAALYAAADVFVLPSTVEPYGTAYGEAMAYGLPVVGWDAGNLPFLARDRREGIVLPRGDVAALADALAFLSMNDDARVEMGEAARRRAATLPTWEETAGRFFGALREVVEGAARPLR